VRERERERESTTVTEIGFLEELPCPPQLRVVASRKVIVGIINLSLNNRSTSNENSTISQLLLGP
jgi:hypothetical protein